MNFKQGSFSIRFHSERYSGYCTRCVTGGEASEAGKPAGGAAVAQGSSTATCPLGRRGEGNNACTYSVTPSQISKLAFNLSPFPNYSISLQVPPHPPTQKLSMSPSLPQSLCSIFLSWQPHCLHKIMPEASRLVSQTSFHNKNLPAY